MKKIFPFAGSENPVEKKIRTLEIRLAQAKNEIAVFNRENQENIRRNIAVFNELAAANEQLFELKNNLEEIVEIKTSELSESNNELVRREKLLQAAASIGAILLSGESHDTSIPAALKIIAEAGGLDRACIAESIDKDADEKNISFAVRYRWSENGETLMDRKKFEENRFLFPVEYNRMFLSNQPMIDNKSDLFGILALPVESIIVVPVFFQFMPVGPHKLRIRFSQQDMESKRTVDNLGRRLNSRKCR